MSQFTNYTAAIYSGYLNLYPNGSMALHYLFYESQGSPSTDPLLIWLNGGPGCSSLLGAIYENGPFVFPDGSSSLSWNDYAWNQNVNVLYLESPAGVGFSYSSNLNYNFTDAQVAQNNLAALLIWYQRFPQFQGAELFIFGESYGGIYAPTFATQIVWYNQNATTPINLVGVAIGDGVTDWTYDTTPADWDFYWNHGLYSPELRETYEQYCLSDPDGETCGNTINAISNEVQYLNNYAIYNPCFGLDSTIPDLTETEFPEIKGVTKVNYARFRDKVKYSYGGTEIDAPGAAPCIDSIGAYYWLNNASVSTALNIWTNVTNQQNWTMCSDPVGNAYITNPNGSIWCYPILLDAGIRMMFFSGDVDGSVPTIGTQKWIAQLVSQYNIPITEPFQPFTVAGLQSDEPQTAGFVTNYQGFRFVQVKGAGHMVAQWARPAGFKLMTTFLNNVDLN
jgi:serine carboxypeptidase-like clade 2